NYGTEHQQHNGAIAEGKGAKILRFAAFQSIYAGVADQAFGQVHFLHDRVTGIDTKSTYDTLVLKAVADIYAGGADLYTQAAIDTVSHTQFAWVGIPFTAAPWLASIWVIGYRQGIAVVHH